jgi:peptidoglycan/LPS O-acetylase OafA/YrhL
MTEGRHEKDKNYVGVQALRGLAALLVVVHHSCIATRDHHLGYPLIFEAGTSGVDIFFAISGFVMLLTTVKFFGVAGAWFQFLLRRLIRVMPLYWFFTVIKIASNLLFPNIVLHAGLRWWVIFTSFLLIPAWNPELHLSHPVPLVLVGWTLSYEMFFYLLFTLSLALSKRPLPLLVILLLVNVVIGGFRTKNWWAPATLLDPLLLEFIFGIAIGLITLRGFRLPMGVACVMAVAMFLFIVADYSWLPAAWPSEDVGWGNLRRVVLAGIPGAILLGAVISLEEQGKAWLTGWPALLGDASYSIYLSHMLVLPLVVIFWSKLPLPAGLVFSLGFVTLVVVFSAAAGIVCHWILEVPVTRFLNRCVRQPDPVGIKDIRDTGSPVVAT